MPCCGVPIMPCCGVPIMPCCGVPIMPCCGVPIMPCCGVPIPEMPCPVPIAPIAPGSGLPPIMPDGVLLAIMPDGVLLAIKPDGALPPVAPESMPPAFAAGCAHPCGVPVPGAACVACAPSPRRRISRTVLLPLSSGHPPALSRSGKMTSFSSLATCTFSDAMAVFMCRSMRSTSWSHTCFGRMPMSWCPPQRTTPQSTCEKGTSIGTSTVRCSSDAFSHARAKFCSHSQTLSGCSARFSLVSRLSDPGTNCGPCTSPVAHGVGVSAVAAQSDAMRSRRSL